GFHRSLERLIARLQIPNRCAKRIRRRFYLGRRMHGFDGLGTGLDCSGVSSGRGFARLVDLPIAFSEFLSKKRKLFLLRLQSLAELFKLSSKTRFGFGGLLDRLRLRRLRRLGGLRIGVFGRIGESRYGSQKKGQR